MKDDAVFPFIGRVTLKLFVIIGDFNICELEEGRFNVRNQTFTEGDAGNTRLFRSYFPRVFEILQPNFTRKDSCADGAPRHPELTEHLLISLWLRRVIFIARLMFLTTLEGPYRVMSQYESSCRNRQIVVTRSSEFRVGRANIPFLHFLKRISDGQHPDEPFAALSDLQGNH